MDGGNVAHIADARRFVSERLTTHGCEDVVPDARLIVSELATNALVHAGTGFTVTVDVAQATVVLRVADGSGAPPVLSTLGMRSPAAAGWASSQPWPGSGASPRSPGGGKSVWASIPTNHAAAYRV